jgi:predicted dehydrogenase
MEGVRPTLVVDRRVDRAKQAGEEIRVPYSATWEDHLADFDAAVLAVPTSDHYGIAARLVEAGKHLLIEKPVTAIVEDAERLADLIRRKGVVTQVGFPERFNPALERALPSVTHPLFVEIHRLGLFSPRSLDVDVVLDLMIHDLDLLHLLLKEEPNRIEAVGIPVLSRNVDIANARLKFPGRCVVNLTASRVSAKRMRKMRLFQPHYYLSMDFVEQSLTMFSLQPNACQGEFPQVNRMEFRPPEPTHPLLRELEAFRDAVRGKTSPTAVSVSDAIPSLRTALAIKKIAESGLERTEETAEEWPR